MRHCPPPLAWHEMPDPLDSTTKILKQDLDKHHLDTFIEHLNADLSKPELASQKKDLLSQARDLLVQAHFIPEVQMIDGVEKSAVRLHDASGKAYVLNARGQESPLDNVAPPTSTAARNVHKSYDEARRDAMVVSAKDINEKDVHAIAYGDTLWDMATASFKKHNGRDASETEIAIEVDRIAKKNRVNPNSIALGTPIYTDLGSSNSSPRVAANPNEWTTNTAIDATATSTNEQGTIPETALRAPINRANNRYPSGRTDLANVGTQGAGLGDQGTRETGVGDQGANDQAIRQSGAPLVADNAGDTPVTATATPRGNAWMKEHLRLVSKAQQSDADIVVFGDSITEGMSLNNEFRRGFGAKAQNFGIHSDKTENLLWRLQNGEADFRTKTPEKAVLMIGTNDIGKASTDDIVRGILANARVLQEKLPNTQLLVVGVLPRGADPNDPLRRTVAEINRKLKAALQGSNVEFADVGNRMLDSQGRMLAGVWQDDNTHPTYGPGYSRLFEGLRPFV